MKLLIVELDKLSLNMLSRFDVDAMYFDDIYELRTPDKLGSVDSLTALLAWVSFTTENGVLDDLNEVVRREILTIDSNVELFNSSNEEPYMEAVDSDLTDAAEEWLKTPSCLH